MIKDWQDILYDEIKDKNIKDDIKRNKAKDNKGRSQSGGAINKSS
jgi:hypothetical protein